MVERLIQQLAALTTWVRRQAADSPLGTLLKVSLLVFLTVVVWGTQRGAHVGFGDTAFWDWMRLLIVPAALAMGAGQINKSESKNDQELAQEGIAADPALAENRQQDARLQACIDYVTEMLLEADLRESEPGDENWRTVRVHTLEALRTLDGSRRGLLLLFLHEAGLIDTDNAIVDLMMANLSKADLRGADLGWGSLRRVDLTGADLSGAILIEANLIGANLRAANLTRACLGEADLRGANLEKVDLRYADLRESDLRMAKLIGADLSGTDLRMANLSGADLSRADLTGAALSEVDLTGANLSGAIVTRAQLAHAKRLELVVMPDGTRHEQER